MTQVDTVELVATALSLWLYPLVLSFIDDITALCAVFRGGARAWDLAHPSCALHGVLQEGAQFKKRSLAI